MIDYTYSNLFMEDSTSKQLIIEFDTTVITNEDLFDQTMTLEESLCSEDELRFGSCEASVLKFKVANIVAPMKDKWLSVKMVLNNHTEEPFIIGSFRVEEDKETSDKRWREIVAYDKMYDIINADASSMARWYNEVLPNTDSTITLREFRTRFISYFGLEQVLPQEGLVNDDMIVEKTIEPEQISGKDIITAICEINGCFGHIGRDGKFHYIYLPQAIQGLYPANDLFPDHAPDYLPWQQRTGHLYPQDPKSTRVGADGTYIKVDWEKFLCKSIDKLQVRKEENDIGAIVGRTGDNCYIIEDNFLVYGKNSEELWEIANKIFNKITDVVYRPLKSSDVKGNPCFEVGDPIRISTKYELIETYILERTLKGIQALRDAYKSNGVQEYSEQVNGVHKSIVQLKGKTNVLTRNIEETRSELKDTEKKLSTAITQNAEKIKLEAERAIEAEGKLESSIEVLAGKIVLKVKANGELATVALEADPSTGTTFKVKAKNISLTAAEVINLMSNGDINLTGKNIKITSTNFKVDKDGNVTCKNIKCENIKAFSISTEAKSDFNSEVNDSQAMRLAQQAIASAQTAIENAQKAINDTNTVVNNLNNTIIPKINSWINQLSTQIKELGKPGIS